MRCRCHADFIMLRWRIFRRDAHFLPMLPFIVFMLLREDHITIYRYELSYRFRCADFAAFSSRRYAFAILMLLPGNMPAILFCCHYAAFRAAVDTPPCRYADYLYFDAYAATPLFSPLMTFAFVYAPPY